MKYFSRCYKLFHLRWIYVPWKSTRQRISTQFLTDLTQIYKDKDFPSRTEAPI